MKVTLDSTVEESPADNPRNKIMTQEEKAKAIEALVKQAKAEGRAMEEIAPLVRAILDM